ncbi:hypothetical protein DFH06DRAFT_1130443 [Mycena polygramma]|nr:hypothetical protein DFH06DRAFT_1130443 [Mycena polygramma]
MSSMVGSATAPLYEKSAVRRYPAKCFGSLKYFQASKNGIWKSGDMSVTDHGVIECLFKLIRISGIDMPAEMGRLLFQEQFLENGNGARNDTSSGTPKFAFFWSATLAQLHYWRDLSVPGIPLRQAGNKDTKTSSLTLVVNGAAKNQRLAFCISISLRNLSEYAPGLAAYLSAAYEHITAPFRGNIFCAAHGCHTRMLTNPSAQRRTDPPVFILIPTSMEDSKNKNKNKSEPMRCNCSTTCGKLIAKRTRNVHYITVHYSKILDTGQKQSIRLKRPKLGPSPDIPLMCPDPHCDELAPKSPSTALVSLFAQKFQLVQAHGHWLPSTKASDIFTHRCAGLQQISRTDTRVAAARQATLITQDMECSENNAVNILDDTRRCGDVVHPHVVEKVEVLGTVVANEIKKPQQVNLIPKDMKPRASQQRIMLFSYMKVNPTAAPLTIGGAVVAEARFSAPLGNSAACLHSPLLLTCHFAEIWACPLHVVLRACSVPAASCTRATPLLHAVYFQNSLGLSRLRLQPSSGRYTAFPATTRSRSRRRRRSRQRLGDHCARILDVGALDLLEPCDVETLPLNPRGPHGISLTDTAPSTFSPPARFTVGNPLTARPVPGSPLNWWRVFAVPAVCCRRLATAGSVRLSRPSRWSLATADFKLMVPNARDIIWVSEVANLAVGERSRPCCCYLPAAAYAARNPGSFALFRRPGAYWFGIPLLCLQACLLPPAASITSYVTVCILSILYHNHLLRSVAPYTVLSSAPSLTVGIEQYGVWILRQDELRGKIPSNDRFNSVTVCRPPKLVQTRQNRGIFPLFRDDKCLGIKLKPSDRDVNIVQGFPMDLYSHTATQLQLVKM